MLTYPIGKKGLNLEVGVSNVETVYNELVKYTPITTTLSTQNSSFYENRISQWQVPIRVEKILWEKGKFSVCGLVGLTASFNQFSRSRPFTDSMSVSDGTSSIKQTRSFTEKRQAAFTVLADFGLRAGVKIYRNLSLNVTALQQYSLNNLHTADYRFLVTESEMPDTEFETLGEVRNSGNLFSLNFGIRYTFRKKTD